MVVVTLDQAALAFCALANVAQSLIVVSLSRTLRRERMQHLKLEMASWNARKTEPSDFVKAMIADNKDSRWRPE